MLEVLIVLPDFFTLFMPSHGMRKSRIFTEISFNMIIKVNYECQAALKIIARLNVSYLLCRLPPRAFEIYCHNYTVLIFSRRGAVAKSNTIIFRCENCA